MVLSLIKIQLPTHGFPVSNLLHVRFFFLHWYLPYSANLSMMTPVVRSSTREWEITTTQPRSDNENSNLLPKWPSRRIVPGEPTALWLLCMMGALVSAGIVIQERNSNLPIHTSCMNLLTDISFNAVTEWDRKKEILIIALLKVGTTIYNATFL